MNSVKLVVPLLVGTLIVASFAVAEPKNEDPADTLALLLKEREDTLKQIVDFARLEFEQGTRTFESLIDAENRLLEARLESASDPRQRIEILELQLRHAKSLEDSVAAREQMGVLGPADLMAAKVERLNVEIALQRERRK